MFEFRHLIVAAM